MRIRGFRASLTMLSAYIVAFLSQLCSVALPSSLNASVRPSRLSVQDSLRSRLSGNASVIESISGAPRWSDFEGPRPGIVVNVATEKDVQETV